MVRKLSCTRYLLYFSVVYIAFEYELLVVRNFSVRVTCGKKILVYELLVVRKL